MISLINDKKMIKRVALIDLALVVYLSISWHFSYPDTLVHTFNTTTGEHSVMSKMDWYKYRWNELWRW